MTKPKPTFFIVTDRGMHLNVKGGINHGIKMLGGSFLELRYGNDRMFRAKNSFNPHYGERDIGKLVVYRAFVRNEDPAEDAFVIQW